LRDYAAYQNKGLPLNFIKRIAENRTWANRELRIHQAIRAVERDNKLARRFSQLYIEQMSNAELDEVINFGR
jgi:hypothetical protein